jgi:hypothetical protein
LLQSLVAWNVMPRSDTARFAAGIGLTLGFVALVEILIAVDSRPLVAAGRDGYRVAR